MPGCEEAYVSVTASQVGIRGTRCIVGERSASKADLDSGKVFDDHLGLAWGGGSLPYRALLPQRVENLAVAGRCISHERDALDLVRPVPPCMATGYAAGTAAALALEENVTPRELDVGRLQASLRKGGVPFPS